MKDNHGGDVQSTVTGRVIEIAALREKVSAAREEFDMAVSFHEAWKPAAYDDTLHERLGVSYASQTFLVIRSALRREMLMALMRLWDKNKNAVGMKRLAETLRNEDVIDALAVDRAAKFGGEAYVVKEMRQLLQQKADDAIGLIDQYVNGGVRYTVFENLKTLRDEHLAHRQTTPTKAPGAGTADDEIETFYQDTLKVVKLLLSVVNADAYDPTETAKVHSHYATLFWAAVRGERTEGHPSYLPQLGKA